LYDFQLALPAVIHIFQTVEFDRKVSFLSGFVPENNRTLVALPQYVAVSPLVLFALENSHGLTFLSNEIVKISQLKSMVLVSSVFSDAEEASDVEGHDLAEVSVLGHEQKGHFGPGMTLQIHNQDGILSSLKYDDLGWAESGH
jgi:hypothetical protein